MQNNNDALHFAKKTCNEGVRFAKDARLEDAIRCFDSAIAQIGEQLEIEFIDILAIAIYNKALALGSLNRHDDAIATYELLIQKFTYHATPSLALFAVKAMRNKAYRLNILQRSKESIATYESLVEQFGNHNDLAIAEHVETVMMFLAERQAALNRQQ